MEGKKKRNVTEEPEHNITNNKNNKKEQEVQIASAARSTN